MDKLYVFDSSFSFHSLTNPVILHYLISQKEVMLTITSIWNIKNPPLNFQALKHPLLVFNSRHLTVLPIQTPHSLLTKRITDLFFCHCPEVTVKGKASNTA